jgi:hypothetical protein
MEDTVYRYEGFAANIFISRGGQTPMGCPLTWWIRMQLRTPHLCYERSKTASDLEAFFEK